MVFFKIRPEVFSKYGPDLMKFSFEPRLRARYSGGSGAIANLEKIRNPSTSDDRGGGIAPRERRGDE